MTFGNSVDKSIEKPRISMIAALGPDRAIGKNGRLLWHLPDDLKRFKKLTLGHPVIMGRKTWESLPEKSRPLPGRTNIVVTRNSDFACDGAKRAASLDEAVSVVTNAPGANEIFVIGGAEMYAAALPRSSRLYLTLVKESAEGDAFFPAYEHDFLQTGATDGIGSPEHAFAVFERHGAK